MGFCQGSCNRVSQPPPELRQGGIPSRGRKQGCFQPGRSAGAGPGWRSGLGDHAAGPLIQQHHGGEVHPGRAARWAGMRGMRQRSFGAVAVLAARDCRARHGMALQQPSGLGRHGSASGGRRKLRSAQRTPGLASCALRGEFISAIGRVSRTLRAEPEVTQV